MSYLYPHTHPRILLVEDDQPLREVLSDILKREGYEVVEAASGEEALTMIAQQRFQAVVLDLIYKTTGLQGIAVLKRMQLHFPELPVIVMSGRASDETVIQTIREGGFSFLAKPIHDLKNVLFLLEKAIHPRQFGDFSTQLQETGILVKGAPVDIHHDLYTYVKGFEDYVALVKGQKASVFFESQFDNVHISIQSEHPKSVLYDWLKTYLGFAEQSQPVALHFETAVTPQRQVAYSEILERNIALFRQNTAKAMRRHYIDPMFGHETHPQVLYLNPLRIVNQLNLKSRVLEARDEARAFRKLSAQIRCLLEEGHTLLAISSLAAAAEQYALPTILRQTVALQERIDRAINQQMTGALNVDALLYEIEQVHHHIRGPLLGELEQYERLRRA